MSEKTTNPLTGHEAGTLADSIALDEGRIKVVDVDEHGQVVPRLVYHGAKGVKDPSALPGQRGLFDDE